MMSQLDVQNRNKQKSSAVQNPVNNRDPTLGNRTQQFAQSPNINTKPGLLPFPTYVTFNIRNSPTVGYCVPYHKDNWNMVQPAADTNKQLGLPQLSPLTVNTSQKPAVKNGKDISTLSSGLGSSLDSNTQLQNYSQHMTFQATVQSCDPRQQQKYGQGYMPQKPSMVNSTTGQNTGSKNPSPQLTGPNNQMAPYGQPAWDNRQVQYSPTWDNGPILTWSNEEATTSRQVPVHAVNQNRDNDDRQTHQTTRNISTNEPIWNYDQSANTWSNQQGPLHSIYQAPASQVQFQRPQETRDNNNWNQQQTTSVPEPYYHPGTPPMRRQSIREEDTENVYFLDLTIPANGRSVADSVQVFPRKAVQQGNRKCSTMANSYNDGSTDQQAAYNMVNSTHYQNSTNYAASQNQHNGSLRPNEYPVAPVVGYADQPQLMQNGQQSNGRNLIPMVPNPCYVGPTAHQYTDPAQQQTNNTWTGPAIADVMSTQQSPDHPVPYANVNAQPDNRRPFLVPNPGYVGPPVQQQFHPEPQPNPAPQFEQMPYPYSKSQHDGGKVLMVPNAYGPRTQQYGNPPQQQTSNTWSAQPAERNWKNNPYGNANDGQNIIPMCQQCNNPQVQVNQEMVNWGSQQGSKMVPVPQIGYPAHPNDRSWSNQQTQLVVAGCQPQTSFQETSQQYIVPQPARVVNAPTGTQMMNNNAGIPVHPQNYVNAWIGQKWEQSPPMTSGYTSMNGNSVSPPDAPQGFRSVKANTVVETMQCAPSRSQTKFSNLGQPETTLKTQPTVSSTFNKATVTKDSVMTKPSSLSQPVTKEVATCHNAETAAYYIKTNPTVPATNCAFKNTRKGSSRPPKPSCALSVTLIAHPGKIILMWDHPKSKEAITYVVTCYDEDRIMIWCEEFVVEKDTAEYEIMCYSGRRYVVHLSATQMNGRCLMAEWKSEINTGFPQSDTYLRYTESMRVLHAHQKQHFSMKECLVVYRFEEEQKINEICMRANFKLRPYPIRPIRGHRIEGTHFFVKTNFNGSLPRASNRGGIRMHFAAPILLSPQLHRFYIADYDGKRAHIVICLKKTQADDYCSRNLISLDPFGNSFLRAIFQNGMQRFFFTTAFSVNLIYTEHLDIRMGQMEAVQVYSRGKI